MGPMAGVVVSPDGCAVPGYSPDCVPLAPSAISSGTLPSLSSRACRFCANTSENNDFISTFDSFFNAKP